MEFHPEQQMVLHPEHMVLSPEQHMAIDHHYGGDMGMYPGEEHNLPDTEYKKVHSLLVDGGAHFGVSALAFDAYEEMLWMGNQGGHLTSYYGLDMQKYTSFQVHTTNEIRQVVTADSGILTLMSDKLRMNSRFGRTLMEYSGEKMHDMQCMLSTSPSTYLMGGHQTKMLELDINKKDIVREVEVDEAGCAIIRKNKYICTGDTSGKVFFRDPKTLRAEHTFEAHSGTLSDFDVHENLVITCGFGSRMGNLVTDHFLMVYDIRMMRAVTPIQVMMDPMFLRFMPTYTARLAVVSQAGNFQLIEPTGAITPSSMYMYHLNTEGGIVMAFDVSSTCNALAFGDSHGFLHLFANSEQAVYNAYSRETEFVEPPAPLQPISITNDFASYAGIPMYYPPTGPLLSDWPPELCQRVYRKPVPIDKEILRTMKINHNVGYAPNPGNLRRNQVPYKLTQTKSTGRNRKASVPDSPMGRGEDPFVMVPKKYRKVEIKYSKLGMEDFDFRFYNKTNFAGLETHIPNAYCNASLQVLYFIEPLRCIVESHLCNREFCLTCELGFLFHMLDKQKGQTCQATNFLRAFRTIPEASALGLILSDTDETSAKTNYPRLIQNWSRFIAQQLYTEISAKEKEDEEDKFKLKEDLDSEDKSDPDENEKTEEEAPADEKEQESADETKEESTKPSEEIASLFNANIENKFTCRCGEFTSRSGTTTLFGLCYPEQDDAKGWAEYKFADVLQNSIVTEQNTQAWCNMCNRYQPHVQSKTLKSLPNIIGVNCQLENARDFEFWQSQIELLKKKDTEKGPTQTTTSYSTPVKPCRYGNQCTRKDCRFYHEGREKSDEGLDMSKLQDEFHGPSWIPFVLKVKIHEDGTLDMEQCEEEDSESGQLQDPNYIYYDIYATVHHVKDAKTGGNLISHTKVGKTYHQRKEGVTCSQWYLFNDFSITPVENKEAVHVNLEWKTPCLVYFVRRNLNTVYQCKVFSPITVDVLFEEGSLVTPGRRHITFTPLQLDELPKKGDYVGLDAEFVSLNQEEAELRSDGTRSTIKPSQMSVARVTCLRGSGDLDGEPFIDDYISTQEQVVDYLTQFSGIKPGDLDAAISSKHLTMLKATYVKLRYLLDLGVIFVGHGLKKDFRVINLVVPQDQIVDTVHLFHLPRQRMISLKFLAWHFLEINIQSVTHDSIEDARTALKLYKKYAELSQQGGDHIRKALKDMYERGRQLNWKIPEQEGDENNPV